jgi:hypothetical protein
VALPPPVDISNDKEAAPRFALFPNNNQNYLLRQDIQVT